jgi:hypothetical protein
MLVFYSGSRGFADSAATSLTVTRKCEIRNAADTSPILAAILPTWWQSLAFPPNVPPQNLQYGGASRASRHYQRRQFSHLRQL